MEPVFPQTLVPFSSIPISPPALKQAAVVGQLVFSGALGTAGTSNRCRCWAGGSSRPSIRARMNASRSAAVDVSPPSDQAQDIAGSSESAVCRRASGRRIRRSSSRANERPVTCSTSSPATKLFSPLYCWTVPGAGTRPGRSVASLVKEAATMPRGSS